MGVSSTIATGYKSLVMLDATMGGALTDISGTSNAWTATLDTAIGSFFTFGSGYRQTAEGGKQLQVQITVLYSTAANEGADILLDWYEAEPQGQRSLLIQWADASGHKRLVGEFSLQSLSGGATAGSGDPSQIQATLLSHGQWFIEDAST